MDKRLDYTRFILSQDEVWTVRDKYGDHKSS